MSASHNIAILILYFSMRIGLGKFSSISVSPVSRLPLSDRFLAFVDSGRSPPGSFRYHSRVIIVFSIPRLR